MSILSILANIIVAVVISLLLWYAIQTLRKQKGGGCGSCGKLDEDGKTTSACKGCAFSSTCHIASKNDKKE